MRFQTKEVQFGNMSKLFTLLSLLLTIIIILLSFYVPGPLYDSLTSHEWEEKIHAWNKERIQFYYSYQNTCRQTIICVFSLKWACGVTKRMTAIKL